MEHVEGEPLRHRLSTDQLSIRESLAAAVSAAIGAPGIKPENVMLRRMDS